MYFIVRVCCGWGFSYSSGFGGIEAHLASISACSSSLTCSFIRCLLRMSWVCAVCNSTINSGSVHRQGYGGLSHMSFHLGSLATRMDLIDQTNDHHATRDTHGHHHRVVLLVMLLVVGLEEKRRLVRTVEASSRTTRTVRYRKATTRTMRCRPLALVPRVF